MKIRHIILDRDGVLNREAPDSGYVRNPEEFHWLPGALDGLAMLRGAGLRISVATNQSGVGRGLMSLQQLEAVHDKMRSEAARAGGAIDAIFFCPHAPEADCSCRKPAPDLIQAAVTSAGIGAAESLVVGDDRRDVEAARRAGVAAALVRTGKGLNNERLARELNVPVFDDLTALAHAILDDSLAGASP
jgi:D-glycero-D-manno-heptose 1,7-bisphosphate phosphatase